MFISGKKDSNSINEPFKPELVKRVNAKIGKTFKNTQKSSNSYVFTKMWKFLGTEANFSYSYCSPGNFFVRN